MKILKHILFTGIIIISSLGMAQGMLNKKNNFTRQDTLRGSITPEREWWDLTYYHLDIEVKPDEKFISGKNTIAPQILALDFI